MKLILGPMTVGIYVGFYARTGKWPAFFLEQLKGVPVPEAMQTKADAARKEELEKQTIRDTRPSGLLEEEEAELASYQVTSYDFRWEEKNRWQPDMTGVCPHCGLRHPEGEIRCGTAANG